MSVLTPPQPQQDRSDRNLNLISLVAWGTTVFVTALIVGGIALATYARGDDCGFDLVPGRLAENLATVAENIDDVVKGRPVSVEQLKVDAAYLDRIVRCLASLERLR